MSEPTKANDWLKPKMEDFARKIRTNAVDSCIAVLELHRQEFGTETYRKVLADMEKMR